MTDFATARRMMVDGQVRTFDVTDAGVLAAMFEVPRERFVAPERAALAYLDTELTVGAPGGRRLLKPMVIARMLQMAAITSSDRILDVGCATGYSAALMVSLAGEVVALEEDAALAADARRNLAGTAVKVVRGPLASGWPQSAPYDVIVVEGSAEVVPAALFGQLKDGGRLVAIVGDGPATKATLYRVIKGDVSGRPVFDAAAGMLPGFSRPPAFVF